MGYLVKISLKREPDQNIVNLGEQEIPEHPVLFGRATFVERGKRDNGRIDSVDPEEWDRLGITPKILVVVNRDPKAI